MITSFIPRLVRVDRIPPQGADPATLTAGPDSPRLDCAQQFPPTIAAPTSPPPSLPDSHTHALALTPAGSPALGNLLVMIHAGAPSLPMPAPSAKRQRPRA